MNYRGSARRLLGNSISAMVGAIEIYNKPRIAYRDEVFVVLLVNAWELVLKAILSKSGDRIYYPKRRGEPYRTLSCKDAFRRASNSNLWPSDIPATAVDANIELLSVYRDNVIHFYNNRPFGVIVYSLAQTAIINYRDVVSGVFGKDIADEVTWRILPLGIENPIDPIEFMRRADQAGKDRRDRPTRDFLALLKDKTDQLEAEATDTGRLLTVFDVSLQSVKKIAKADIVAGISSEESPDVVIVSKPVDPNQSHPFRQTDVLSRVKSEINQYDFQAIAALHSLRNDRKYCWVDSTGTLVKWSPDVIRFIDSLTPDEISDARRRYSAQRKKPGKR